MNLEKYRKQNISNFKKDFRVNRHANSFQFELESLNKNQRLRLRHRDDIVLKRCKQCDMSRRVHVQENVSREMQLLLRAYTRRRFARSQR